MNLTRGNCAMTYQMPNAGHCAAHCTWWVHTGRLYAATCHTCHGNIPGYVYGRHCFYTYGCHQYCTSTWSWVGVIGGHNYYGSSTCFCCNIFGAYQTGCSRPLFFCAAHHNGLIVPGKLDQDTRTCYYLGVSTHCYSTLLAY